MDTPTTGPNYTPIIRISRTLCMLITCVSMATIARIWSIIRRIYIKIKRLQPLRLMIIPSRLSSCMFIFPIYILVSFRYTLQRLLTHLTYPPAHLTNPPIHPLTPSLTFPPTRLLTHLHSPSPHPLLSPTGISLLKPSTLTHTHTLTFPPTHLLTHISSHPPNLSLIGTSLLKPSMTLTHT